MWRTLRRKMLGSLPEPMSKIIRCIGAPNKYIRMPEATYHADSMATQTNADFQNDPLFIEAYRLGKATTSWADSDPIWRAYVACWAAYHAKNLEGDYVECGVNKGGTALAVAHYTSFNSLDKDFWLLDTYQGLVADLIQDYEEVTPDSYAGYYKECYDEVVKTFSPFPRAKIIRGAIPDTLEQVTAKKVSFLSIDMNCVVPEIAAIEFFWDRLVPGAIVVLDDYGWSAHKPQKDGFDQFTKAHNTQVLTLPTGQGLIVKP